MFIYTVCQLFVTKTNSWFWLFVPHEGATHPLTTTSKKFVRNSSRSFIDTRKYLHKRLTYMYCWDLLTYCRNLRFQNAKKKIQRCLGHCKRFSLCLPQLRKVVNFLWFCIPLCQHFLRGWFLRINISSEVGSSVSIFPLCIDSPVWTEYFLNISSEVDSSVSTFPPRLIPQYQHFLCGWLLGVNISSLCWFPNVNWIFPQHFLWGWFLGVNVSSEADSPVSTLPLRLTPRCQHFLQD
jgi:hypothetical protein